MAKEKEEKSIKSPMQPALPYLGMNDGTVVITFSSQAVEAHADFIPPVLGGNPLGTRGVTAILESLNIVNGIRWDNISKALDDCNIGRLHVKDVLVAKGEEPIAEIAEYYERNPLLKKTRQAYDEKAKVNHREFSPFVIVKKGQTLAKLRPHRPGKEGINVHGELIPFGTVNPVGVNSGANTHIAGDRIISDMHGQLIEARGVLNVQENLIIRGAVGYRTGHIIFPGNVSIDGPVSDGFKIYSGGTLTIKQTLDLTEVVSKGDISVAGGIIGKGAALIKAGGGINTKFIENCRIAARGPVFVESGIINSNIYAMDSVRMGDKGLIVGGEIYSVHGLRAGGIGRKGRRFTKIHCGIDFAVKQELEKSNNQLRVLVAKLTRVRELIEEPEISSETMDKMVELLKRLEGEQAAVTARISDLIGKVNIDEKAVVEVVGEISAGTLIEICQVSLFVEAAIRKVRVRLDTFAGKLVTEPL